MAIVKYTDIAQFPDSAGFQNEATVYAQTSPSLAGTVASHAMIDHGRFYNEAFSFWFRTANAASTGFRVQLGTGSSGAGPTLALDFTAGAKMIRLVNAAEKMDAAPAMVVERDVSQFVHIPDNKFIRVKVIVQDRWLKVFIGDVLAIDYKAFTPTGTHFGFSSLNTTTVYISDLVYYYDQIIYGNVNINGAPNANGVVVLYNQSTFEVIEYQRTDIDGEYLILIEDDPKHLNKYFMYGFVEGETNLQPRGVSNITL